MYFVCVLPIGLPVRADLCVGESVYCKYIRSDKYRAVSIVSGQINASFYVKNTYHAENVH